MAVSVKFSVFLFENPACFSGSLSRAGTAALTSSLAEPPSPSKPGSMEDAIRMWLKIGNVERLQVRHTLVRLDIVWVGYTVRFRYS